MKKLISAKNGLGIIILVSLIIGTAVAVDVASLVQQKIALERSFEDRLRGLLEKILGTDRFIVIVNVEPETEATEVARETWVQEKGTGEVVRKEKKYVLPGVPLREKLGEETAPPSVAGGEMKREYERIVVLPKSFVRRVVVTIILDEKIDESLIETVRAVVNEIMGLDAGRGDTLVIKRQHFSEPITTALPAVKHNPFYWAIFAVAILLLILFPLRIFLRGLARIVQSLRPREVPVAPPVPVVNPGIAINPVGATKEEKVVQAGEEKLSRPFSFINQENIKHLLYLLRDESVETISVIVAYLNPREATQVMGSLPRDFRAHVTERLARVREVPASVVRALEESIKEKIGYVIGGEEQLVEIMEEADKTTREEILQSLRERQPDLAERVRKQVFVFEDIINLDDTSFQMVFRELDLGTISLALRGVSEEIKSKIMGRLSEGVQAMLRQEMELGKPAGKQKIDEAQRRVVRVVRALEKEGRIGFRSEVEAEGGAGESTTVVEKELGSPGVANNFGEGISSARTNMGPGVTSKQKQKTRTLITAVIVTVAIGLGYFFYQQLVARKSIRQAILNQGASEQVK